MNEYIAWLQEFPDHYQPLPVLSALLRAQEISTPTIPLSRSPESDVFLVLGHRAARRAICFHENGPDAECYISNNVQMIIFGAIQLVFSQIPDFSKLWVLSFLAAAMSFGYSFIGIGLSIGKTTGMFIVRSTPLLAVSRSSCCMYSSSFCPDCSTLVSKLLT